MNYEKRINYLKFAKDCKEQKEFMKGKKKISKFKPLEKLCAAVALAGLLAWPVGVGIKSKTLEYIGMGTQATGMAAGIYLFKKNNNWRREQYEKEMFEYVSKKEGLDN
jgi:hypothetical protein